MMSLTASTRERNILILSILTIINGAAQIALERSVITTFREKLLNHSTAWPPDHWSKVEPAPLRLVPDNLATPETRVIIACGALSIFAGIVGAIGSRTSEGQHSSSQRLDAWPAVTGLWSGVTAFAVGSCFLYVLVEEYILSSRFRYTNYYSTGQHFTREGWVCQMRDMYTYDEWVDWQSLCIEARAGRWLFVPILASLSLITWMRYTQVPNKPAILRRLSLLKQPQAQEQVELMRDEPSIPDA